MIPACLCGGALEVGLFALIVTAVSAFITWIVNMLRAVRAECKHVDDGGMFHGFCKKCGEMLE